MDRTELAVLLGLGGALAAALYIWRPAPQGAAGIPLQPQVTMIAAGPGRICCGARCTGGSESFAVPQGSQLLFTAVPNPGHYFLGFDDPRGIYISSTGNPLPETITESGMIRANFA